MAAMGEWATASETGICLNCHKAMEFKWRIASDGSKLEVVAPAHEVGREPDERKPGITWVTLQMRCRCGAFLGILVDLSADSARAAAAPA
jgi:hypothetical protein